MDRRVLGVVGVGLALSASATYQRLVDPMAARLSELQATALAGETAG